MPAWFIVLFIVLLIIIIVLATASVRKIVGGTESNELEKAYARWLTVHNITSRAFTNLDGKNQYEAMNALERLLLSLANLNGEEMFAPNPENAKLIDKFRSELIEKHIEPDFIVSVVENAISAHQKPTSKPTTPKYNSANKTISYKKFSQHIGPSRFRKLQKVADIRAITRMLLNYSAVLSRGQKWAAPAQWYKHIQNTYGLDLEAFASPINSRAFLSGGKFGSVFYESDKIFGSVGNIFELDFAKFIHGKKKVTVVLNSPFIEDFLNKSAKMLDKWAQIAETAGIQYRFIYICPDWSDADYFQHLSNHPNLQKHLELPKMGHHYKNIEFTGKKYIVARFKSHIFVISNVKDDYTDIGRGFLLND